MHQTVPLFGSTEEVKQFMDKRKTMSTPISNHFSYEEFERSSKAKELAIDNRITSDKIRFACGSWS